MSAKIGVLALQGDVREHARALVELGAHPVEVRRPEDLSGVDGLVLPGGESTTMAKLADTAGLWAPISQRLMDGMAAFGTCAGMILLAGDITDGRPDQRSFGAIDITVRRNGYGRQVDSFETELTISPLDGGPLHAVFIRAPLVESTGSDVEVLATLASGGVDRPVVCRQGPVVVTSFHPELSGDLRLHELFLKGVS